MGASSLSSATNTRIAIEWSVQIVDEIEAADDRRRSSRTASFVNVRKRADGGAASPAASAVGGAASPAASAVGADMGAQRRRARSSNIRVLPDPAVPTMWTTEPSGSRSTAEATWEAEVGVDMGDLET